MLRAYPKDADPMAALRTAISALGMFDPDADDITAESVRHKALFLTAQTPTIVAAYDRIRRGLEPLQPREGLSFAGNFLYMLNGEQANDTRCRTMDVALVLHADTGDQLGPLQLCFMLMRPGAMLTIICRMKNGERRSKPFSSALLWLSSKLCSPPMPLPTMTPTISGS